MIIGKWYLVLTNHIDVLIALKVGANGSAKDVMEQINSSDDSQQRQKQVYVAILLLFSGIVVASAIDF